MQLAKARKPCAERLCKGAARLETLAPNVGSPYVPDALPLQQVPRLQLVGAQLIDAVAQVPIGVLPECKGLRQPVAAVLQHGCDVLMVLDQQGIRAKFP